MAKNKKGVTRYNEHGENCLCKKCRNREEAEWRRKVRKLTSQNWRDFIEDERIKG